MRALAQKKLLAVSIPSGAVLGAFCAPLILSETHHGTLRALQLASLPCICVLLIQAALAWTPDRMRLPAGSGAVFGRGRWLELAVLAAVLCFARVLLDPVLRRLLLILPITTWGGFLRKLPFSVLVQPLFMVIGVYAFSLRLFHRADVAIATVVLSHQLVVWLQFSSAVSPLALATILVVAGVDGLAGGFAYHRYGVFGAASVAAAVYARHGVYLLIA